MAETATRRATPRRRPDPDDASTWTNVLAEVPLFRDLGRRNLAKVARTGRIARFHDQTPIVRAGERGEALFVVLDGAVDVRRRGHPDVRLGAGSFFGEMALLDGGVRSASVVAAGPVTCLVIGQSRFHKLLRGEPAIAIALLKEVAARLRAVQATA